MSQQGLSIALLALLGIASPLAACAHQASPHSLAVLADRPADSLVLSAGALVSRSWKGKPYAQLEFQLNYRANAWFEVRPRIASNGADWTVDVDTLFGFWGSKTFGFALNVHLGGNVGVWGFADGGDMNLGVGAIFTTGTRYFRFTGGLDFIGGRVPFDRRNPFEKTMLSWRALLGFEWDIAPEVAMYNRVQFTISPGSDYIAAVPQVSLGVSW